MDKNYYYILGINLDATQDQVKKAFRKLSHKFHPDKNGGDIFFEERFKEIREAYEILSDVEKRRSYDLNFNAKQSSANNNFYRNFEEEIRSEQDKLKKERERLKKEKEEFAKEKQKFRKDSKINSNENISRDRNLVSHVFTSGLKICKAEFPSPLEYISSPLDMLH